MLNVIILFLQLGFGDIPGTGGTISKWQCNPMPQGNVGMNLGGER
jgi:hypothetical protein